MTWIDAQIDEIERDRAALGFGIILALTHVLTFWSWGGGDMPARFAFAGPAAEGVVCWPFLPGCQHLHFESAVRLAWATRMYLALAVATTGAFAWRRVRIGYGLLVASTLFKLFFYLSDYRFGGEVHVLALFATVIYLAVPGKVFALRAFLTVAAVFVGLVRVRPGWLGGADVSEMLSARGFTGWLWQHGLWPFAAAWVTFALAAGSPLLMSRRPLAFWIAFAHLALLHVIARPWLGPAGTSVVFALTLVFPLAFVLRQTEVRLTVPALVVLSAYAVLQILPWVTPGDSLLTGEGRLGAVTLFEGGRGCHQAIVANYVGRTVDLSRDNDAPTQMLGCDPYFNLRQVQQLCEHLRLEDKFQRLGWRMQAGRGRGEAPRTILALDDACGVGVRYAWYGFNTWITR